MARFSMAEAPKTSCGGSADSKGSLRIISSVVERDCNHDPAAVNDGELYYTKEDYVAIKLENAMILRRILANASFGDQTEHCPRGLEDKTPEGSRSRFIGHLRCVRQTLQAQDRQRELGICDPESIAEVSRRASAPDKVRAQNVGTQDALAALEILKGGVEVGADGGFTFKPLIVWASNAGLRRRCDSSSTGSTQATDDLSDGLPHRFDHKEEPSCLWDDEVGDAVLTILDPAPTPVTLIRRILQPKSCWTSAPR
jgi:hypothetical protein